MNNNPPAPVDARALGGEGQAQEQHDGEEVAYPRSRCPESIFTGLLAEDRAAAGGESCRALGNYGRRAWPAARGESAGAAFRLGSRKAVIATPFFFSSRTL